MLSAGAGLAAVLSVQTQSSLEQDYAILCANKAEPESETCATLKRALVAKLSGSATAMQPGVEMPQAAKVTTDGEIRSRWGLYADIVGKKYFSRPAGLSASITSFSWQVPGEVLVMIIDEATKRGEVGGNRTRTTMIYRWDWNRNGIVMDGYDVVMRPEADGSFFIVNADGKHRNRTWLNADGSWTSVTEKQKGNVWKPITYGEYHYSEMTPQFIASLRGSSGGGGLLGVVQGAIAGAAGMANGGGGDDAAIAGAAAGAVAGAAGVEANSIQTGFQRGAAEVNASNAEMQRSFERSVAAAGAPGYAKTTTSTVATSSTSSPSSGENPSAAEKLESRTVSAWFVVGMMPREKDTRNPLCVSNSIPVTIDYNPSGWGNDGRVLAALKPLESVFLEKCGRLGQVAGSINPMLDGSPNPHPDNYQVQVP